MTEMTIDISTPSGSEWDHSAAELFQVLASPIRLAVLRALVDGERCVSDLLAEVDIAQSRLSNHLACLRHCGFVTTRRAGTFIYYTLADDRIAELVRVGTELARAREDRLNSCAVVAAEREG